MKRGSIIEPLPIIGVQSAMLQGDGHDGRHLFSRQVRAATGVRKEWMLAPPGGGGVRAGWQEWRKTLTSLQRTAATAGGSGWQPDAFDGRLGQQRYRPGERHGRVGE